MPVSLTSSKAKVPDFEKLEDIVDRYELDGFEIKIDCEGNLELVREKEEGEYGTDFPQAFPIDQPFDEEAFDDASEDDRIAAYSDMAYEGFIDFLRELSTVLETPLMVLRADVENNGIAEVWRVQPGAKEVETLVA
jgi:hypothetical protein